MHTHNGQLKHFRISSVKFHDFAAPGWKLWTFQGLKYGNFFWIFVSTHGNTTRTQRDCLLQTWMTNVPLPVINSPQFTQFHSLKAFSN